MLRVLGVLVLVALYIYFIIDVLRTPSGETRSLPKFVWLLLVVLLPVVGGLLWLALGRVWPAPGSRFGRRRGPLAPDDDPTFLKQIGDDAWVKRMQRRRGETQG
ncbi:MAG: PLDc N-terminal domain-containing protein [Candidatus Nanopelagicales bacterium]